jgi:hypothetical protein
MYRYHVLFVGINISWYYLKKLSIKFVLSHRHSFQIEENNLLWRSNIIYQGRVIDAVNKIKQSSIPNM